MFFTATPHIRIEHWNVAAHTEKDAYDYCGANNVHVVEDANTRHGMFVSYKGYDFILINTNRPQIIRTWILWHEIGHYLLHEPSWAHFSEHYRTRSEREANFIAAVAMIPRELLITRSRQGLLDMDFPDALVGIRERVYDATGI